MTEITKFESAPIANISDFVQIQDEQVYTTSRIVAEKFGKRHDHVVRDIEATISTINEAQVIENKAQPNFGVSENINGLKNQLVKTYKKSGLNSRFFLCFRWVRFFWFIPFFFGQRFFPS